MKNQVRRKKIEYLGMDERARHRFRGLAGFRYLVVVALGAAIADT
jgi:hypothetical protein